MTNIDQVDATNSDEDADDAEALETSPGAGAQGGAHPEELRKRELLDEVVERSGIKKRYAKPVVEAMLAVLGEAAAIERDMNLQPFGKVRIARTKDIDQGRVVVMRLRQNDSIMARATYGTLGEETSETAATVGEITDDFDDD